MTNKFDNSDDARRNATDIPETSEEFWNDAHVVMPAAVDTVDTSTLDDDFSVEAHAALGRLMRTFSILEHEIMRAAIGIIGGPEVIEADDDLKNAVEKAIGASLGGRLKFFSEAHAKSDFDPEWLADFQDKLADGITARNHFAHGIWSELPDGRLKCVFYARGSKTEPVAERAWLLTSATLHKIAASNIKNARILAEHFHPPQARAAE